MDVPFKAFQEFGGCLWLDTGNSRHDYFHEAMNDRVEVDSGRSAIQYIIENYKYDRIWLPVYRSEERRVGKECM